MKIKTDIVVVGGGQAGVCAAIAAAQEGKKVVLVQDRPVLGGNASSEAGVPSHGAEAMAHNRNLRDTGLLEEMRLDFYINRSPYSDSRANWDMILLEKCLSEKNLTLFLNTKITGATLEDSRIHEISGFSMQTEENLIIGADVFIDATGDGFLSAISGAEFRQGREGVDEFNEQVFGQKVEDKKTLGSTVYGWAVKRDYPVPFKPPTWAIRYESCESLAHRPHSSKHLFPTVTSSKDHHTIQFFWWLEWGGQLDVIKDNDKIYRHLLAELYGVWDHLKNSCTEETRKLLENFELTHWTNFPLRRESRRIVGDYILNENDIFNVVEFKDRIGFGGWPMDDHPPEGISSKEPPCDQVFLNEPYNFPYRSAYAKDIENLFIVGRCMSVTHSALSTIRVMNTLGSIGEAIGTAAAICIEKNTTPRNLGLNHIDVLQQRILNRDLYLLGMRDSIDSNKAKFAEVTTSSNHTFRETGKLYDTAIELEYDTAMQIPISSNQIESLQVCLRANKATSVNWKIFFGRKLAKFESTPRLEGTIEVTKGTAWYDLKLIAFDTSYGDICTLVLEKNKLVEWLYGDELFQTRWGISYQGSPEGIEYHGRARRAPQDDTWIWINHHGRMPSNIESWLSPKKGYKIHGKLYATPSFRISPEQSPYDGTNIINGINRPEDWPNIWISEKGLPQWASLHFDTRTDISRIELYFDTQLDYSDQKYGFPRGKEDYSMPHIIEETVKRYRIEIISKGSIIKSIEVDSNIQRRCVHGFQEVQDVDTVVIHVLETWGVSNARIFAARIF